MTFPDVQLNLEILKYPLVRTNEVYLVVVYCGLKHHFEWAIDGILIVTKAKVDVCKCRV